MKDVLSRIEPKPKKVIDLSPELTEQDYKLITDMMNLHNGKYIDVWKGYSDTDLIPNIEKLALFNRSMRLSKQADDFLQFNPDQWDVVVDGIVRKPKESIVPLLEYKVNSDEINKALSTGEITPAVQKKIDAITNYLNLFETKKDLTVYRGEKSFGLLKSINFDGKNLGDEIENLTQKIEDNLNLNNYNENKVLNFIENNLMLILWLAEERFPDKENDLTQELLGLKEKGLEIKWCEDLRSYKKLVPALREFPEDIIVTADDDLYIQRFLTSDINGKYGLIDIDSYLLQNIILLYSYKKTGLQKMNIIKTIRRFSLKNKDITIFTNNCLAGFIYQRYELKYLSPTIGINIEPMDFIKFCKNYEYYLNQEIFETKEYNQEWFYSIGGGNINFPVGKLGDITLYFQHASSFEEAVNDWNRRKKRVNYNNIFIILYDTEPTSLVYNSFKEIKSKNKLYLYHKGINHAEPNSFFIKDFENSGRAWWSKMNRLNPFSKKYFEQFNYTKWFNSNY